jgi:hypothetical protein
LKISTQQEVGDVFEQGLISGYFRVALQKVQGMDNELLILITDDRDEETADGSKGWATGATHGLADKITALKQVKLPIADLEKKMEVFLTLVGRLFRKADQQATAESGMRLKEVELQVEISGEGEIRLVAGGKAAAKGAITLRFERVESGKP